MGERKQITNPLQGNQTDIFSVLNPPKVNRSKPKTKASTIQRPKATSAVVKQPQQLRQTSKGTCSKCGGAIAIPGLDRSLCAGDCGWRRTV